MKVALLGTGLMGFPMAERILSSGHQLYVYNRTKEKAEPLRSLGAHLAETPQKAIKESQCVILMLSDEAAICATLFSSPQVSLKDKTIIQMGTIASSKSIRFGQQVRELEGEYIECPVLGSIKQVKDAELIMIFGGSEDQFSAWEGFLKCFGPNPKRVGDVGQASAVKLAMNQLIVSLASMFSLSLGFVQKKGVKEEAFMDILRISALYAPAFDKKMPRMLNRDYTNPNFPVKHMLKDVNLFLGEARALGLSTEQLEGVKRLYEKALQMELGAGDYSAVFDVINPK